MLPVQTLKSLNRSIPHLPSLSNSTPTRREPRLKWRSGKERAPGSCSQIALLPGVSFLNHSGREACSVISRTPNTPVRISLRRQLPSASFVGCADIHVSDVAERSDECVADVLFAAIPGTRVDGLEFVGEALSRGASALLVQRPLADVSVPQCVVPNVRQAYNRLCAALTGDPSRYMAIAGVTGTNGKTTVTWLIRSILQQAQKPAGVMGTIEYHDGACSAPASLTTPDARTLSHWLASMIRRGATHAAIEISSHALDQGRVGDLRLQAALVTNVTHDHFDYHGTYGAYLAAKARIVGLCPSDGLIVLNADDSGSMSLADRIGSGRKLVTYGLDRPADVSAKIVEESLLGSRFRLDLQGRTIPVRTPLIGRHNVSNCLAAAAVASYFGCSDADIAAGIESLASVPGRLETIDCGQPFDVLVDYAHTQDALERCLTSLRPLTSGRLVCVFGAGGDRDASKRPLLGRAASAADVMVVTSDNPRTEDPSKIIREIVAGCDNGHGSLHVEPDREAAIQWALDQAEPGDCVLVAGKGHEVEQIIGSKRLPFDDREIVRRRLLAPPKGLHDVRVQVGV